jgi:thiamine-phosphate pyrophosphorylase
MCCLCSKPFAGGLRSLKAAASQPIVCYVTDRKSLNPAVAQTGASNLLENIRAAVEAGVNWVQIREKDLPARELLELARQAVQMAAERGEGNLTPARIIMNDRLDVALAAGAHGVHLGHESLGSGDAIRWCRAGHAPAGFATGVSCHSLEEAREAKSAKADYIFWGPIFETPSKLQFGPPQGLVKLAEVCRAVPNMKVVAIGGVNAENAASCIRAGAAGIAAIRMFQESNRSRAIKDAVAFIHNLGPEEKSG